MESKFKKYFGLHPEVKAFHFTTDGQAFIDVNMAKAHQRSLTGKPDDVSTQKRPAPSTEKKDKAAKLQSEMEGFQALLLEATDAKEKAALEEKIKVLKGEIDKLK